MNDATIESQLLPLPAQPTGDRRVWSIPLQGVLVPFFTATNARGKTDLAAQTLGAPLRLAKDSDGSVRFSKSGKPVVKVVKDISDQVKLMRDNYIAGLLVYTSHTVKAMPKEYKAQVEAAQKAGEAILKADAEALLAAIADKVAETPPPAEGPPARDRSGTFGRPHGAREPEPVAA